MAFDRPGFDKEVGLLLQLARRRREVTQAELAKKIGLPRASYANFESGRQRIPVDILWRAAVVLNVSLTALVPEPINRTPSREPIFPPLEEILGREPPSTTLTPTLAGTSFVYGTSTAAFPATIHDHSPMQWSFATIPAHVLDKDEG